MAFDREVFVGREREMAELAAALDDALAGRGRIVMLAGEPGIGKTRTAEELSAVARERGAEVLWGRCPEDAGAPPFWVWVQVIRSHIETGEPKALRAELGKGAAAIAAVVPEVSERLGIEPAPALEDLEAARFRLFDSIVSILRRAAETRPLVIVLDNLHWSDGASLRLLEFIAPEISGSRLLILGTYRDIDIVRGHALFRSLGELYRQRLFQRVALRGIGTDGVRRMLEAAGVASPPSELVELMHSNTEGNPFFIREAVALLSQEGLLTAERLADLKHWKFRLPEGVREVIGRRLDRLSRQCNAVLGVASLLGREFDAALLGRLVVDVSPGSQAPQRAERPARSERRRAPEASAQTARTGSALEVLEEAIAAQIIESIPGSPGRYRFAHALIQQTLREEVPTARQVRVHALIATTLEQLHGARSDEHAAELASHFAEAEPLLGRGKVIRYSMLAGEQARASHAYEDALGYFKRAEAVARAGPEPVSDATMADILAGQARSMAHISLTVSDRQGQWDTLTQAFDLYVETGDHAKAAELAQEGIGFAGLKGIVRVTERALGLVPPESEQAGWISVRYAGALLDETGDFPAALAALDRAYSIGEKHKNLRLKARVLAHLAQVHSAENKHRETVSRGLDAIRAAREAEDPWSEARVAYFVANSMAALGDPDKAAAIEKTNLPIARKLKYPVALFNGLMDLSSIARLKGDWDALRDGVAEITRLDSSTRIGLWLIAAERCDRGPLIEGLEGLRSALDDIKTSHFVGFGLIGAMAAAARVSGADVYLNESEAAANGILEHIPLHPRTTQIAEHALGFVAAARGNTASAAKLYAAVLPRKGLADPFGGFSIDRLLGLLAGTNRNRQAAAAHFEDALAFCQKAGYRPEQAWTCHDHAEMLLSAGGPQDRLKTADLLDGGEAIAGALGMKPLSARLATLRARLDAPRHGRPIYPAGLSEREVEVLRLIASGQSNQQAADRLFISANTVANHVRNILTKTGCANRTEAAIYANKHGLVS